MNATKPIGDKTLFHLWRPFRDAVGRLSVREKMRPAHWQRALRPFFEMVQIVLRGPEDRALVGQAITEMMESSRAWCNPELGVDDAQARAALRKACNTILAAKDSAGENPRAALPSDKDGGQPSQPVDVAARTAELARELGL